MGSRVYHLRVEIHVRCVEGVLGLGGHVVIGVVRLSVSPRMRNTKCRVLSFWILLSNSSFVVRLYSVIVNFIFSQIVAHFCIAKTGHLRWCLYKVHDAFHLRVWAIGLDYGSSSDSVQNIVIRSSKSLH